MKKPPRRWMNWTIAVLAGIVLGAFIGLGPPNLFTKADLIGYAVCHRIESHSFEIGSREFPLCARCTGTFLGALTGLFGQVVVLRRRREAEFPPAYILAILIGFIGLMGFDGLNSYLTMIPGAPYLYEPQQWLRLTTGALNGLALISILLPLVNYSLWKTPSPQRTIKGLGNLLVLLLMEAAMVGGVLSGWPPLLYPLALASALGVLTMLTLVNTVIVLLLTGWENQYSNWREAIPALLLGMTVALLQVGVIDLLRYAFTGTLKGGLPGLDV
ncbi:MAG: DUF2085 domain-containing protein [Anaerolineae bacterium]|nr:DUF2085 domain-containing protein [Anaerolineae bacterium]